MLVKEASRNFVIGALVMNSSPPLATYSYNFKLPSRGISSSTQFDRWISLSAARTECARYFSVRGLCFLAREQDRYEDVRKPRAMLW